MKRIVHFESECNDVRFVSVEQLLLKNKFVGFEPHSCTFRFLVIDFASSSQTGVLPGPIIGVRPNGFWPNPGPTNGKFYVFDSRKELLYWMGEKK